MLTKDQLLRYATPDETAADFLSRQVSEAVSTGLFCIDQHVKLRPGQVLELAGPTGTGKTELLAQIATHFITTPHGDDASTAPGNVVLIDLDCKFDPLRIVQIINARAQPGGRPPDLEIAMGRFHMARCHSSAQFLALLATLPLRLQQMQGKCSLLLIDNIGAYSWQDRASRPPPAAHPPAAAAAPGHAPPAVGAGDGAGGPPLTLQRVHAAGAALLQLLALRLRVAVVATKSANVGWQDGAQGDAARMVQRDYLPASWQRIVTHRLLMQPGRPPVVDGQQEVLTHVAVQLQTEGSGHREPPTSIYIGGRGVAAVQR